MPRSFMASGKHKDLYVKVFMDFWISSTWPPPPVPLACETNTEIQTPHNNIKHCCKTLVKCYSIWTVSSNLSLYHYVFAHIQTVSLWISGDFSVTFFCILNQYTSTCIQVMSESFRNKTSDCFYKWVILLIQLICLKTGYNCLLFVSFFLLYYNVYMQFLHNDLTLK